MQFDYNDVEAAMAQTSHISRKYKAEIFLGTVFVMGLALNRIGRRDMIRHAAQELGLKNKKLELTAEQQLGLKAGKRIRYETPVGTAILALKHG